jgi:GNAT superfamily N-acetyltransferase
VVAEFDIKSSGFNVRLAQPADATATRMLLPDLSNAAVVFVATDCRQQLMIAAAAMTHSFRPRPLAGPGIEIYVIPPCRGHGIGRALLRNLELVARNVAAKAIYATRRVELDSEQMRAWERLGFTQCEIVKEHVMPLDQFEPRLAPLVDRLRQQGRIPPSAQIIPLYRSDLPAVLRLHLDHLGGERGDIYRKLRGEGSGAFHPRYSCALMVDGQVKGCILAHRKDEHTAIVDANIVDPALRGGWANLWLKLEATRGALRLGIDNFEFTTFDHYADTRRFTEKLGGVTTRITVLMYRPLD